MSFNLRGGVQGVQVHPTNFDLVKILAKSLKIWAKSCENLLKIPENLGKVPEKGRKWRPSALIWNNGRATCEESHEESHDHKSHEDHLFLKVIPKTIVMRKHCGPKIFRASLGKFGQKSFTPPKCAGSYTYVLSYLEKQSFSHHICACTDREFPQISHRLTPTEVLAQGHWTNRASQRLNFCPLHSFIFWVPTDLWTL